MVPAPGLILDSLLDHGLPLSLALPDGEAVDLGLDLGPPLPHVVLDVEDEGVLPEVGVHHLAWGLEPHRGVQVGLEHGNRGNHVVTDCRVWMTT